MFKNLMIIAGSFAIGVGLGFFTVGVYGVYQHRSNEFARDHVVQLSGNHVLCTGIEIQAPSGSVYTLTAAHCEHMVGDDGKVDFEDEHHNTGRIKIIKKDNVVDLMLLDQAMNSGFRIAKKLYVYEPVHSMAHGIGMPSYRTDGEILFESRIIEMTVCTDSWTCITPPGRIVATVPVLPGASGGPLLDSSNDLVGVIDATYNQFPIFSAHVTLGDVKDFLKGY
jgi:hypothetical protein